MNLTNFPRVRLTQSPTPLEFLPNLTEVLGGPNIYIKRDDNTGLAMGGNKTRKLEFLIGDAIEKRANHIITVGATQSNHVRQTIAAAAKFKLKTTALLEERVSSTDIEYYESGNVLLDRILGATLETRSAGLNLIKEMEDVAIRLRNAGDIPYIIPGGGSNPIGALGYVESAQELITQANDIQLKIDYVIHATGSSGTQAGLVVGFEGNNAHIPVLGVSVRANRSTQEENVRKLAKETWKLLNINGAFPEEAIKVNADYVGEGYGISTPKMLEAIELLARNEGIFLDPVYSGKGFAGLIDLVRKGTFKQGENVVFIHTGGAAGLFGYRSLFNDYAVKHEK